MKRFGYLSIVFLPIILLIVALRIPAPPWPDAILYDSVARDFLQTGLFRYHVWADFDPTYLRANFNNGPLYPVIHILFLKIFGSTDARLLILLNYVLLTLSSFNIRAIFRLRGAQNLLLLIIVANPLVLNTTQLVRPEWVNVFLLTCMWRLLNTAPGPLSIARYVGLAALLSLAAYQHQFAIFFIPCLLYAIWVRSPQWPIRLRGSLILAIFTAVFFAPYLLYSLRHWDDFSLQLVHNQIQESAASQGWVFLRSFVTPLFYPSTSLFTLTGQLARWQFDCLHISLIFAVVALVQRWRIRQKFSTITVESGLFWLFLNLGCALTTFNAYVAFFFSVFAVGMMRDMLPVITRGVKVVIFTTLLVSMAYQTWLYTQVKHHLFNWQDYDSACQCLDTALPPTATVYVLAYPDPSVALQNRQPHLDIRRYIDFAHYAPAWNTAAHQADYFITSADHTFLDRFDYHQALRQQIRAGQFEKIHCDAGPIHYELWRRHH